MFVKQIDLKAALELAGKGMEIKVLAPEVPEPKEWTDYFPDTLQNMLSGCLFFRSEAAMINPEFEAAVQNMVLPPPNTDKAAAASSAGEEKLAAKRVGSGAKRKQIDVGKIKALRNAGWSMKKIADEMSISEGTVWNYLKKMEGEKQDEAD